MFLHYCCLTGLDGILSPLPLCASVSDLPPGGTLSPLPSSEPHLDWLLGSLTLPHAFICPLLFLLVTFFVTLTKYKTRSDIKQETRASFDPQFEATVPHRAKVQQQAALKGQECVAGTPHLTPWWDRKQKAENL